MAEATFLLRRRESEGWGQRVELLLEEAFVAATAKDDFAHAPPVARHLFGARTIEAQARFLVELTRRRLSDRLSQGAVELTADDRPDGEPGAGVRWAVSIERVEGDPLCAPPLCSLKHTWQLPVQEPQHIRLPAVVLARDEAHLAERPDLLDWEAELAVVIGKGGRDIPAPAALDHVFGYTAANDLSARDLQFGHKQWFKGKSLDGTCPLGPWVVTADEVGDPQQLSIECRVNGVVKQKSTTSAMIFDVATIIESLSAGLTLEPGDVIVTGTPEGVGFARTPPEFLRPGDVVEVEVERVGVLRTRIVDG